MWIDFQTVHRNHHATSLGVTHPCAEGRHSSGSHVEPATKAWQDMAQTRKSLPEGNSSSTSYVLFFMGNIVL